MFSTSLNSAAFAAVLSFCIAPIFAHQNVARKSDNLDRPVLFDNGLSKHVDASFWVNLEPTPSIQSLWKHGTIPQRCYEEVTSGGFNVSDVEVFNVTYTDCDIGAWVMCRHKDANLTQVDMIDLFGRMPVRERQWVQHIIAVPASGNSAYTVNKVTVYQGHTATPSVFQHETAHAIDFENTGPNDVPDQSSDTAAWKNAIKGDTCVPDDYANTNYVEDYAQVSVLALYEYVTPGGLNTTGAKWQCLEKQKDVFEKYQGWNIIPGGKCNRRYDDSPVVFMNATSSEVSNSKRTADAINLVAKFAPRSDGRMGLPNQEIGEVHVHHYENLVYNEKERREAERRQKRWNSQMVKAKKL